MEGNRINCDSSIADMGCGPAILDYGRMAVQLANVHCFTIRNTETKAMTDTLTPADLDRLQAICDAGPGRLFASDILDNDGGGVVTDDNQILVKSGIGIPLSEFIAAACNSLPAALATIRRLRELLGRLPPYEKLLLLADWFDVDDARKGRTEHDEVQKDLRQWAATIADIRAELGKDG